MLRRTTFFAASTASPRGALVALLFAFGVGCGGSSTTLPAEGVDAGGDGGGGGCPSAQTLCGGSCTNTKFDPANCGACGTACGAGEVCVAGACAGSSACTAPLALCGTACVDPRTDENNCGKCGVKCVDGEMCAGDKGCVTSCPGALTACDKACFDTQNDPAHCGACTTACASGEVCVTGKCQGACSAPLKNCGGACTNTDYDPNNCGLCGVKCSSGVACVGGACGTADPTDDDGDTISNFHEGKTSAVDTDVDGKADYLDDDSDGDGILDKNEAGDTNPVTPPLDSDGDGKFDFQDTDSDNDGLLDKDEVTKYSTSPIKADTDGDGFTDFEEVAAGTSPTVATSNPGTIGGFSFDLPYKGLPRSQDLTFRPSIKKLDVAFVTDTTGSMGGTITGLRTSLKTMLTDLKTKVPDVALGIGDHKDFPISPYGSSGDFPFKLRQRVTTDVTLAQTAVDGYVASGGNDIMESQIEALYQAATGAGFRNAAGTTVWTAKFDPTVGFDATKGHGSIGGMGFRGDAAPVVVLACDASMHRASGDTAAPPTGSSYAPGNYSATGWGTAADQKPKTVAETVTALTGIGARVIGINVKLSTSDPARPQLEYFALKTGSYVAAAGTTCPHGISGATVPAIDDGTGKLVCPLVFDSATSGSGFSTAVVDAITKLTSFVSFKTIWVEGRDNAATATLDESKFFVRAVPVSYEKPLPTGCTTAPAIDDLRPTGGDGVYDSFNNVCPKTVVTFTLVLKNDLVPAKCEDQVFSFTVVVIGDGKVEADSRVVTVRVPGDKTLCK
ncbi:MAG: hypothetical protein HYV09_39160 [Deltaproteobacteria bacterium]|nr:hypothetical protein [Deltaproteobacteria bacterium]